MRGISPRAASRLFGIVYQAIGVFGIALLLVTLFQFGLRGQITGFTGVDDPYEEPVNPELTLYTIDNSPEENARIIVRYLEQRGFILPDGNDNKVEAEEQTPESVETA